MHSARGRRRFALISIALTGLLLSAARLASAAQSYVSDNAGGASLRVRPSSIHLVSNESLYRLKWSSWGRPQAIATGTDHSNSPSPGRSAANPVQVKLRNRKHCGSRLVYTTIRVRFTSGIPYANEPRVISFPYGCPPEARSTTVTIFRAFTSTGAPAIHTRSKSGYCWTGSLTANRNDAWRCFVGNFIYDPCFSSAQAPRVVICPNAWLSGAIEIDLTKGLPEGYGDTRPPSLHSQPWNVELTNGHHCTFSSGATTLVEGQRLNYFCTGGLHYGLWGFPIRRSEPWTIRIGPFNTQTLDGRRTIRHVWT